MRSLHREDEAALRAIAQRHGYLAERGPHAREGSASRLVDALVADELVTIALTPAGRKKMIALLEGLPSHNVHPDTTGVVQSLTAQLRASLTPTAPASPIKKPAETARRRLTSDQAATLLKLSASRVQELARQGIIAGRKDEGRWTFTKNEIARYQQDRLLESQARALPAKRKRRQAATRSSRRRTNDGYELLDWLVEQQRAILPAPTERTLDVEIYLRVENNSKFVRGKTRAREEIERDVLSLFGMRKSSPDSHDYILTIPYTSDEDLENTIYQDILAEADLLADDRHCFVEASVRALDGSDRSW
jgi:hypothetical protein